MRLFSRFALALMIIWALVDAVLSAKQSPTFWFGVWLFILSAASSGFFIGCVVLLWGYLERRFRKS